MDSPGMFLWNLKHFKAQILQGKVGIHKMEMHDLCW